MSDQELIFINKTQFDRLDFLLSGLVGALNRLGDFALNDEFQRIATAVDGLKGSGGSNAEVLAAINNLDRKVDQFMATQEERLQAVLAQLASIQSGVDAIQQAVEDFKANNPALEDEIAGIESAVAALAADVNPPTPEPEPTPEPVEPTP